MTREILHRTCDRTARLGADKRDHVSTRPLRHHMALLCEYRRDLVEWLEAGAPRYSASGSRLGKCGGRRRQQR